MHNTNNNQWSGDMGNQQNPTQKLNKILDDTIKRLLRIPRSMPRDCIYKELNVLDIEHRIKEKG